MSCDIDRVRAAFPGRSILYYSSLDSTMNAAAGQEIGTVVVADEQTAGQGRHGHSWHSETDSGLYVSVVLEPAPVLTLALGLAAVEAVAQVAGVACDLRWPNDVMIGHKKTAGILAQLADSAAVAGIGVNVNHQRFPEELAEEATSLRIESGREHSRERLLIELLPAVDRYVAMLEQRGGAAILDLFSRRSSYASGKRVVVRQGGSTVLGTTAGLNDAGFLVVRKDDGSDEIILAGGVRAAGSRRG